MRKEWRERIGFGVFQDDKKSSLATVDVNWKFIINFSTETPLFPRSKVSFVFFLRDGNW